MAVTIVIVALLALAIGFIAGGLIGIACQAKWTGETLGKFTVDTADEIMDRFEQMEQKKNEWKNEQLEKAHKEMAETMDRLEHLNEIREKLNDAGEQIFGRHPQMPRFNPMATPMSNPFLDLLERVRASQKPSAEEKPEPASMHTMGDRFNELWGGDAENKSDEKSGNPETQSKEEE